MPCKFRNTSGNSSFKAPAGPQQKTRDDWWQGTIVCDHHTQKCKTFHACICEAHESTSKRIPETQHRGHDDHIAERGFNSMSRENLVHKPNPMHQAMKIPDAKAAVAKMGQDEEYSSLARMKSKANKVSLSRPTQKAIQFILQRLWTYATSINPNRTQRCKHTKHVLHYVATL